MITLTISSLREHDACEFAARVEAITAHLGRRPDDDEAIPLLTWASCPWIDSDGLRHEKHSGPDLFWALRATEPRDESERIAREVACRAAERCLQAIPEQDRALFAAAIQEGRDHTAGRITNEQRAVAWSVEWLAARSAARSAESVSAELAARLAAWSAARSDLISLLGGAE